jgi:hypothetical protein
MVKVANLGFLDMMALALSCSEVPDTIGLGFGFQIDNE